MNCKLKRIADTEYRLVAQLVRELGKSVPPTGLPTDEVYNIFFRIIDHSPILLIIILDEVDQLVNKAGDEILYNLTRINAELKNSQVGIMGISNNIVFSDSLDPRVKSSLSEEEVIFPPYNAMQIQDILKKRAAISFKKGALGSGVIEKCAAFAAREHGDARRALEILRIAGEIAERKTNKIVEISDLDEAEEKMERNRVHDIINTLPQQSKASLYCILKLYDESKGEIFTGDVYSLYKELCKNIDLRPLTQRRVSDIISELDMFGIINGKVISKGRYGRTKQLVVSLPVTQCKKISDGLEESLGI